MGIIDDTPVGRARRDLAEPQLSPTVRRLALDIIAESEAHEVTREQNQYLQVLVDHASGQYVACERLARAAGVIISPGEMHTVGSLRVAILQRDEARAEIERLRAELAKPVAGPWNGVGAAWWRIDSRYGRLCAVRCAHAGWRVYAVDLEHGRMLAASGPEVGPDARALADAAAVAAGWRLP